MIMNCYVIVGFCVQAFYSQYFNKFLQKPYGAFIFHYFLFLLCHFTDEVKELPQNHTVSNREMIFQY